LISDDGTVLCCVVAVLGGSGMRFSTRPCPAQGSRARSTTLLYVAAGLGLAALSISADSVAQDAATPDTAALDSAPSEPLSDRERRRQVRRQADAQAKAVRPRARLRAPQHPRALVSPHRRATKGLSVTQKRFV
jgi:hypothetical protein